MGFFSLFENLYFFPNSINLVWLFSTSFFNVFNFISDYRHRSFQTLRVTTQNLTQWLVIILPTRLDTTITVLLRPLVISRRPILLPGPAMGLIPTIHRHPISQCYQILQKTTVKIVPCPQRQKMNGRQPVKIFILKGTFKRLTKFPCDRT